MAQGKHRIPKKSKGTEKSRQGPKQAQNPAGRSLSLETLYLGSKAYGGELWVPVDSPHIASAVSRHMTSPLS